MAAKKAKTRHNQQLGQAAPGFTNPGFICYQSSVLQALFHCAPFTMWLDGYRLDSLDDGLICQLKHILQIHQNHGSTQDLNGANMVLCQKMDRLGLLTHGKYEAADEFLMRLVEQVRTEIGESDFQTVRGLFSVFDTVQIKLCPFPDCHMGRQAGRPIETLGLRGVLLEMIEKHNKFHGVGLEHILDTAWGLQVSEGNCDNERCRGYSPIRQTQNRTARMDKPSTFPKMLLVLVDRLQTTHNNTHRDHFVRSKIDWPVVIPDKLYLDKHDWLYEQQHGYSLFSVVSHRGSPDLGHYKAVIKDPANNVWLEFDDSVVSLLASRSTYDKAFEFKNGYPPAAEAAWSLEGFSPFLIFYLEMPNDT